MNAQPLPPPPPPAAAPMPMNTPALNRGWLRDLMRGIRQEGVQPQRPAHQGVVGPAASSPAARPRSLDARPAALHLAEGSQRSPSSQDDTVAC